MVLIVRSLVLFIIAGLFEIGGGWLVWQWLRAGRGFLLGLVGAFILILYGVVPTLQSEPNFGRVYAAYGGIFVVLSLIWGWRLDQWVPDRFDIVGAAICLLGVAVIMWSPRG